MYLCRVCKSFSEALNPPGELTGYKQYIDDMIQSINLKKHLLVEKKNELYGILGTTDIYSLSDCLSASLSLPPTHAWRVPLYHTRKCHPRLILSTVAGGAIKRHPL